MATYNGTNGDDVINAAAGSNAINAGNGNNKVTALGSGNQTVTAGTGNDIITTGDGHDSINAGEGNNLINAGNGNNSVNTGAGNDTITAGSGNDQINAGNGRNIIDAGEGQNNITSGTGDDEIRAGAGNDQINAGDGNNVILAGGGNNNVTAGSGNDTIVTGSGNDQISAGNGNNTIDAGAGNNNVNAGTGDDRITALAGNDQINAGDGRNVIDAGDGNNVVNSGRGDDTIDTGSGNDTINAGDGINLIDAGNGRNTVNTGSGADDITTGNDDDAINAGEGANLINAGNGDNRVTSGAGADRITAGSGDDEIHAGEGANVINAGDGCNEVTTGAGNDTITSGSGNDAIYAGEGNNIINAGDGINLIYSGSGNDRIITGSGSDIIYSGNGDDFVDAGGGSDAVYLDGGNDTYRYVMSQHSNTVDVTWGGSGTDTLQLVLTADQARDARVISDIQRFNTSPDGNGLWGWVFGFQFTAFNLSARDFETIDIVAPVDAINDSATVNEDAQVTVNVLANDLDLGEANNSQLRVISYDATGLPGTLTLANNQFTFVPGAAYQYLAVGQSTTVTFSYAIGDNEGYTDTAIVTLTITGSNDGPVAVGDVAATTENAGVTVDVLANDTDLDANHVFTLVSAGAPAGKGSATVVGNKLAFNPGTAFDHLAAGVTETVIVAYTMKDDQGATSSATLTITVTGTNDGPVAVADVAAGTENQVLTVDVLANDTDLDDGYVFTLIAAAAPAGKGVASVVNNKLVFTPGAAFDHLAAGAVEVVMLTYTMKDDQGAVSNSTLTVTITGTNDGPVAVADVAAASENQTITVDVLANDTDLDDGHVFTLTGAAAPLGKGAATVVGNQLVFMPGTDFDHLAAGATEVVVVSYTMQDDQGASSVATLAITITGTNDAPVAVADAAAAIEDGAIVTGTVAANDSDVDDGATHSFALDAPTAGLTLNANGSYSFDPSNAAYQALAAGELLTVVAHYTITDDQGATAQSTLTITLTGTNDAPIAVADIAAGTENQVLTIDVLANDTDVDHGASFTLVSAATPAGKGAATVTGNQLVFTPGTSFDHLAAGAIEVVTLSYTMADAQGAASSSTVTVTITGTNDGPVAVADIAATTENTAITIDVLANDTDLDDGHVFTLTAATAPAGKGTASIVNDQLVFTPGAAFDHLAAGATEVVTVTYAMQDDQGAESVSTLTITVTGTNDAPVAVADVAAGSENQVLTIDVLTNDTDVDDAHVVTLLGAAAPAGKGLAAVVNNRLVFAPGTDFDHLAAGVTETVVVSYVMTDEQGATSASTVTVTVTGTNDAPVAGFDEAATTENAAIVIDVLANDTDLDDGHVLTVTAALVQPGQGSVAIVANQLVFTPGTTFDHLAAGDTATVVVFYSIRDDKGAQSAATVTITVTGTNDAPVAFADTAAGTENQVLTVDVLANDTDLDDGHVLTLASASAPAGKGAASVVNNQLVFTPGTSFDHLAAGAIELVTLSYTVRDDQGATSTSTVTVTVTGTNDAPVAIADFVNAIEDGAIVAGSVAANDSDIDDGATRSFALNTPVAGLTFNADGSYSFDASNAAYQNLAQGMTRVVTAAYTVTDDLGASAVANLTITVTGTNDVPVVTSTAANAQGSVTEAGNADNGSVVPGVATATGVLAASDVDANATLNWSGSANGTYGTFAIGANGAWTYTLDNTRAATQALREGQVVTETFNATVRDQFNAAASQAVTVTVNGTNDAPVIVQSGPGVYNQPTTVHNHSLQSAVSLNGLLSLSSNPNIYDSTTVPHVTVNGNADGQTDWYSFTVATAGQVNIDVDFASFDSWLTLYNAQGQSLSVSDDAGGDPGSNSGLDSFIGIFLQPGTYYFQVARYPSASAASGNYTLHLSVPGASGSSDYGDTVVEAGHLDNGTVVVGDAIGNGTARSSDVDANATATWSGSANGAYGSLAIAANGVWAYTLDNNRVATQGLREGQTVTETFAITVTDDFGAAVSTNVVISVQGTNDVPVAQADTASALEGASLLTGSVAGNDSDVDTNSTLSYALVSSFTGLSLASNGSYTFDPANGAYNGLAQGQVQTLVATYRVTDERGASTTSTLTITLTGTNDAPVAVADTAAGTENQTLTINVLANDTDADAGHAYTLLSATAPASKGSASVISNNLVFTPGTDFDHLAAGAIETIVVSYAMRDEFGAMSNSTATITITGTNDAPVAVADVNTATEDNIVTGSVAANDGDVDDGTVLAYSLNAPVAGLTLNADGSYSFDAGNAAYQSLADGQIRIVIANYTVSDGVASATATLTITLTGANDAPVITSGPAAAMGTVVEAGNLDDGSVAPGTLAASGTLTATDVDNFNGRTWSVVGSPTGAYGSMAVSTGGGVWTYTLDNNLAATQALAEGQSVTEAFTIQIRDGLGGFADQVVTVTILGTNDAPVLVADIATAIEDGAIVTGTVAANDGDPDAGAILTYALSAPLAGLTLNADGSYSFDPSNAAYQSLADGQTRTFVANYTATDEFGAVTSSTLSIQIAGTNDAPVITSGPAAASDTVIEAGNLDDGTVAPGAATAIGTLTATDIDNFNGRMWSVVGSPNGAYGTMAVNTGGGGDGIWTYTLDNDLAATQALAEGQSVTEAFTIQIRDGLGGFADQVVTVTILGTNDAPVITSTAADAQGTVIEAGAANNGGTASTAGALASSDVDNGATAIWSGSAAGAYGAFAINAAGVWTYTLDNDATATQGLSEGQVVFETFTATVTDDKGATALQTVAVQITGAADNYAPTADAVAVTTGENAIVAGNFSGDDVDADDDASTLTYRLLSQPATGTVTQNGRTGFSFAPGTAFDDLALGENRQVNFTYAGIDSHGALSAPATVTVTVTGTNDAPVITSSAALGAVVEAGNLDDGTVFVGTPSVIGTFTATDVDNGAAQTWTVVGSNVGTYGNFALNAAGAWTYTLDNNKSATQALAEGQSAVETFTVRVTDDKGAFVNQTETLNVTGTNDAPVAVADSYAGGTGLAVALTGEILVNTQTNSQQYQSAITALSNGTFVVTWADASTLGGDLSGYGVKAQLFTAAGAKIGTEFLVNTETNSTQFQPQISALSNGGFVVTWSDASTVGDTTPYGVKAQIYNASGTKVGTEFLVNTVIGNSQTESSVTGLANGGFVVTWSDTSATGTDTSGSGVKAQLFSATGAKVGGEFLVNTQIANAQTQSTVTALANGGFVVTWTDASLVGGDASGQGIKAQVYSGTGVKVGGEFLVNTLTSNQQNLPTITALASGGFAIAWADASAQSGDLSGYGIRAAIYNAAGVKQGSDILVNTQTTNTQYQPSITSVAGGGFMVTWSDSSLVGGDNSGYGIKAQLFSAAGIKVGGEFLVNTSVFNTQDDSAVTFINGGTVAVVWTDASAQGGDTSSSGIKLRLYSIEGPLTENTTATIDVLANDTDVDTGKVLTLTSVSAPVGHGVASIVGNKLLFTPGADFDHLAQGTTEQVVVQYTVTDDKGAIATGTATLTVIGTNDLPVVTSAASAATGAVAEDGIVLATGQLTSSDLDDGATATWGMVSSSTGTYGSLTINAAGTWTYTLNNASAATQALDGGETAIDNFTVKVTDDKGGVTSQVVAINVSGNNDAPTVSGGVSLPGNFTLVANRLTNGDFASTPDYTGWSINTTSVGTTSASSSVTINRTGSIIAGDNAVAQLTYSGQVPTPYGTGQGPTITSAAFQGNQGDTIKFVYVLSSGGDQAIGTGYIRNATTGAIVQTIFNYQVPVVGSTGVQTVELTLAQSGSYTIDFRVGSYDATGGLAIGATLYVGTAQITSTGISEDVAYANASGRTYLLGNATDIDGDTLVIAPFTTTSANGVAVSYLANGTLTIDPRFAPLAQALSDGEKLTDSFTYTISDGHGGSVTTSASYTLVGINDAPVAVADTATTGQSQSVTVNVLANDYDVDHSSVMTLSAASAPAGKGTVSIVNNQLVFNPGTAFAALGAGQSEDVVVSYTVKDQFNLTSTSTATIPVTGPAAPVGNLALVSIYDSVDGISDGADDGGVGQLRSMASQSDTSEDQIAHVSVSSLLSGETDTSALFNGADTPATDLILSRADLIGSNRQEATAQAETLHGTAGDDVFVFRAGTAQGDTVLDFDGAASGGGDRIEFVGFGHDAVFTQIDESHWQIDSAAAAQHEVIAFEPAVAINTQDFAFV